jgi:hypothetical protein
MLTHHSFQGFPLIRLESNDIRVDVLPNFGGKILQIEHRVLERKFLWHNPHLRLQSVPLGASYDDNFFGGWDDLLPNDIAETVNGIDCADHGELWTMPLTAQIEQDCVQLSGRLPLTPLEFAKRIELLDDASFRISYSLHNVGQRPLDLLLKMHPALRISPGAEIRVPADRALVGDPAFSRFGHPFQWPNGTDSAGKALRADLVPEINGTCEFLYLNSLRRGECALAHREENWQFHLSFDSRVFPCVWLFASYGGWQSLEMLILEPCTTWPISIPEAAAAGQRLRLGSGEDLKTALNCRVGPYEAVD